MTPPKLRTGDQMNFETLLRAANDGALALVSAIRKADQQSVALVCAMQTNDDDTHHARSFRRDGGRKSL